MRKREMHKGREGEEWGRRKRRIEMGDREKGRSINAA